MVRNFNLVGFGLWGSEIKMTSLRLPHLNVCGVVFLTRVSLLLSGRGFLLCRVRVVPKGANRTSLPHRQKPLQKDSDFKMMSFSTSWSTQYSKTVWPLNTRVSRKGPSWHWWGWKGRGVADWILILRIQNSTQTTPGHDMSFSFNSNPRPACLAHSLGGDQAERRPPITKLQSDSATQTLSLTWQGSGSWEQWPAWLGALFPEFPCGRARGCNWSL